MRNGGRDLEAMLGEPKRAIRGLALALSVAYLVAQVNAFVDTFWSSSLGVDAMSAVSVMSPVYQFIAAVGTGLGVGVSSRAAFHLGAGDRPRASAVSSNAIILGVLTSLGMTIAVLLLLNPVVDLLDAGGIRSECLGYTVPMALMASAIILQGVVAGVLRAEGSRRGSAALLVYAAAVNAVLDPVLMYGLNLGVVGAGVATCLSSLVSVAMGVRRFRSGRGVLEIRFGRAVVDRSAMREVMGIAAPRTLESMTTSVANILQRVFIADVGGTAAVMCYNLAYRYPTLSEVPAESIGAATIPVCSAARGQGDIPKMRAGLGYSVLLVSVIEAALAAIVLVLADPLMEVFMTGDGMDGYRERLVWTLRMFCILIPFNGFRRLGSCMLQVIGRSRLSSSIVLVWASAKLVCYGLASLSGSYEVLIGAAVLVYAAGGIAMTGSAWYLAGRMPCRRGQAQFSNWLLYRSA